MSQYGVYVIQLRGCDDKSALGALYVGSSWYQPSERFRQHHEGAETGSAALYGECRRLRPELYIDLPWHWDRRRIVALERQRARRLGDAGFQVRCDGRVHSSVRPELRTPFDSEELERVSGQFDEFIPRLVTSARRELTLDDLVHALRWTPGSPDVAELVAVPNECVGRFSHAAESAVYEQVRRTVQARPGLASRLRGIEVDGR